MMVDVRCAFANPLRMGTIANASIDEATTTSLNVKPERLDLMFLDLQVNFLRILSYPLPVLQLS